MKMTTKTRLMPYLSHYRVHRGGPWGGFGTSVRAGDRLFNDPGYYAFFLGFRVFVFQVNQ